MRSFFVIFLLLIPFFGSAQDFKKELKEANKLFKSQEYSAAQKKYKKLLDIKPADVDLAYKYGACVVMTSPDNEQALKYLKHAEKSGKSDKEIAFFMGKAYENNKDYANAIVYYERFMAVADKEQLKNLKVKKCIKSCKKMLK
jgi:tetratricopeptide (TPR) repeat protein